jgi:hypothetical protein
MTFESWLAADKAGSGLRISPTVNAREFKLTESRRPLKYASAMNWLRPK